MAFGIVFVETRRIIGATGVGAAPKFLPHHTHTSPFDTAFRSRTIAMRLASLGSGFAVPVWSAKGVGHPLCARGAEARSQITIRLLGNTFAHQLAATGCTAIGIVSAESLAADAGRAIGIETRLTVFAIGLGTTISRGKVLYAFFVYTALTLWTVTMSLTGWWWDLARTFLALAIVCFTFGPGWAIVFALTTINRVGYIRAQAIETAQAILTIARGLATCIFCAADHRASAQ